MIHCHEMKKGDVYGCRWCGFEIKVMKRGEDLGWADQPGCGSREDICAMRCCGQPLDKKS